MSLTSLALHKIHFISSLIPISTIRNSRCSRQKSSRHGRDESRQESPVVQNRERQPQNQLRLIVSLCWHVCWVLLLATGAVTAPFAFALSLFSLEPVVFCTPSLSSLVPFSLSACRLAEVAGCAFADDPSPPRRPSRGACRSVTSE